jgi:hypothetical protein
MAQWIEVGNKLLNVDQIEYVELVTPSKLYVYMTSGAVLEITDTMGTNLYNLLVSNKVPFLDSSYPTRGFSAL